MCEVTPYMVSVVYQLYITVCRGISVIYHSAALLISTTGVVYIYIEHLTCIKIMLWDICNCLLVAIFIM